MHARSLLLRWRTPLPPPTCRKADKLEEQQAAAQDYLLYANDSSMLTQVGA